MKKIIIKTALFLIILLAILVVLSFITMPKNNDAESGILNLKANGILGEKENTIDMLVVGDSESFASIIPMQIWDEHGYTSYVCGTPAQTLSESYSFVHNVMKKQKLKLVVLEANNLFRPTSIDDGIEKVFNHILPVTEYHSRWKHLKKEDFYKKPEYVWTHDLKGYDYSNVISEADATNYMTYSDKKTSIDKENILYIKLLKNLCKKNNSKLLILSTPSTINWSYEDHNATENLAKRENIEFLDLNLLADELKINWATDTRDKGDHLNHSGAKKATKYLGEYLNKKNILENHKNDERYIKWHEDFEKYKKTVSV